ncbi:MAG: monovalent cation/H(+) antiporter subunit G [Clostridia bacterium]|nr:monovalent cation/H(+) antiporter subunit G [Clostridia bacterium]
MSEARFILCAILCAVGIFTILSSIIGVFRFRFVLNRMHCAALIDTLGSLFLFAALMIASPEPEYFWKLLSVLLLLWIGSPLASHLVSRMELATDKDALSFMEHPGIEEGEDAVL